MIDERPTPRTDAFYQRTWNEHKEYPIDAIEFARTLERERDAAVEALKLVQFGFNHRRCSICAGWNVGPNGETDKVHMKTCPVGTLLAELDKREKAT